MLALGFSLAMSGGFASVAPTSLFGRSPDLNQPSGHPDKLPAVPDEQKLQTGPVTLNVPSSSPDHLTHPCGGMFPEPPFEGLSPLAISYVQGMCSSGYGDIAVWQHGGHDYVGLSGFGLRMYHIYNVDDPYNPVVLRTQAFPTGGTASTTIFDFKQNGNQYMSVGMRGSGTGCGWFVYNVNDPANPQFVVRKTGTDWCTIHEHFVSESAPGQADYAWLTMSGETGSGYKIVVLDISDLANPVETGRYQRPDAGSGNFIHDVNVVGERVFVAHWGGGMIMHDKQTLAHNVNPTPITPIDGMRPSSFWVHHTVPTTDGRFVFLEDEFLNTSNAEKIKYYDIQNLSSPVYLGGIIGQGIAATSQAHNMVIKPLSPGHDLLLVAWYRAGTRAFEVDTTGATAVVTQVGMHQLRQTAGPGFGNVWGVDYLPCTLEGQPSTCIYSSDMTYGLIVDAYGYNPALDPYNPEGQITSPTNGQIINTCSFSIEGTAHDYYSGVQTVEVSTDDGNTWSVTAGTPASWTYSWSIPADGSYSLRVRVTDVAGNTFASTPVAVTVAGGCGGSATNTPEPTATNTPQPPPTNTPTTEPSATATTVPCTMNFSDVLPADYFYEAVRYLYCAGVISGYSDGTFRPYNETTRGQLTKIVVLAFGLPIYTPSQPTFTDVPATHTFYQYIETAAHEGLVSGYSDGTFRPGSNVTRGQLSKIVVEAAGWTLLNPPTPTFSDVPTGHTFYEYVETAVSHQVVSGYADGTFRPGNNATRGQISKIVHSAVVNR
jgi:hypothetical protein